MADTIGYQLAALIGVQTSLLVEEVVHIHATQLSDTLLLRHALIKFVNCLFHIHSLRLMTGPQQSYQAYYRNYLSKHCLISFYDKHEAAAWLASYLLGQFRGM